MPPIANDRVAWSVGLFVGLSPSEPCKNSWTERDAIFVEDSGRPKKPPITYSRALPAEYCIVGISHNTVIWFLNAAAVGYAEVSTYRV